MAGKRAKRLDLKEPLLRFIQENLQEDNPRRLHICSEPIEKFITKRQRIDMKPTGLWYGINDSWIDWVISNEVGWLQPLIYEVVLDPERTLCISNLKEFEAFEDEYYGIPEHMRAHMQGFPDLFGPNSYGMRFCHNIDYPKLSKQYGALEITPYLWKKRLEAIWYYGWDCASGCVWSKKAVKELRLIAEYDLATGEYILK